MFWYYPLELRTKTACRSNFCNSIPNWMHFFNLYLNMLCNFHTFFIILNLCIGPVVSLFHFFLTCLTVFYPIYTNLPIEKISSMKNVQTFFHIHKLSTFHSHKNCPFLQLFTELCTLSTFLPWKTMTFQPLFFKHTFCLFLRFSIFYNFFCKIHWLFNSEIMSFLPDNCQSIWSFNQGFILCILHIKFYIFSRPSNLNTYTQSYIIQMLYIPSQLKKFLLLTQKGDHCVNFISA